MANTEPKPKPRRRPAGSGQTAGKHSATATTRRKPGRQARPAVKPPYTSELLLTIREAAHMLRISERKMYYLLADEIIRSLKINRSRRIKRSVIDDYIASLEQMSA